jgi:hypothetical protein
MAERIKQMKNLNDPIRNRTRDFMAHSTVPQPNAPLHTPYSKGLIIIIIRRLTSFVESFDLLNKVFPFHSVLNTGCPIFNIQLADILYYIVFPSLFGPSFGSYN